MIPGEPGHSGRERLDRVSEGYPHRRLGMTSARRSRERGWVGQGDTVGRHVEAEFLARIGMLGLTLPGVPGVVSGPAVLGDLQGSPG